MDEPFLQVGSRSAEQLPQGYKTESTMPVVNTKALPEPVDIAGSAVARELHAFTS